MSNNRRQTVKPLRLNPVKHQAGYIRTTYSIQQLKWRPALVAIFLRPFGMFHLQYIHQLPELRRRQ
jgi:hypothetical protein